MTSSRGRPPDDPLADPRPLVTRGELDRLTAIRARRPWYTVGRDPDTEPAGDAAFLLVVVDRLLTSLDRYRAALDDLEVVVAHAQQLDEAGDSPGHETACAVRMWRGRLLAALDGRAGEDGR